MGLGRYVSWFFGNWRASDAPARTKLLLVVRNRARATKRLFTEGEACCGHHGEPGC